MSDQLRGALLFLLSTVALHAPLPAQQVRPEGVWYLDRARSDSLHLPFRDRSDTTAARPAPPQGGGAEGAPGAGPGAGGVPQSDPGRRYGGGRYGRGMQDKDLLRIRLMLSLARSAPQRIEVRRSERQVTLTDSMGFEMVLTIGGAGIRDTVSDLTEVTTRARWDSEVLVVERSVKGAGRIRERYALGLDGTRLLSFVEVTGLFQPLAFTRQYGRTTSPHPEGA